MAEDWPQFRGPNRDGIAPMDDIAHWDKNPPREMWRVKMGDESFAGPSVSDGVVYIVDHEGDKDIVRALDLASGKEKWRYAYKDSPGANYGYHRATPTVDGDRVYTLSRLGVLNCLKTADGELVWSKNILKEFGGKSPRWQMAMSPMIDGEKLIVVPGGKNAAVAALNKMTGETIWTGGGSDIPGYATPEIGTINGKKQYVISTGSFIIGVDPENGDLLWEYGWVNRFKVNAAAPLILDGDRVFITSGYRHGCAMLKIEGDNVKTVWRNRNMMAHFSSPVFYEGHIYGNSDPNHLVCLDPQTGKVQWKHGGFGKGGTIVAGDVIVAMNGRDGDVVMVAADPEKYRELGRIKPVPTRRQAWTAPIVADGKLIVRNQKELVCLDLK
jgi:outer membrane protein assembly factor BamB